MPDQSGTKPPFVTPSGTPVDVSENGTPNDFVKNATSDTTKGGEFDVTRQNRLQPTDAGQPPTPLWLANRPQQVGGPQTRVNTRSIPDGGVMPPTPTKQAQGGTSGVSQKPFKVR